MKQVLVIDNEDKRRETLTELLLENGFFPIEAPTYKRAIEVYKEEYFSAVLLELKIPDIGGIEIMKNLKKLDFDIPIIIMTEFGDIPTAVETIKLGAYDFIVSPPKVDRLTFTLNRAIEKLELKREINRLNTTVDTSLERLLGISDPVKRVIDQIHQVSWSNFSIIIQGDTGTGKSFIANTIHNMSKRAKAPFVKVDIGAIPETLVESELFGHEKGAFTGADRRKKGYFEMADGGTIFIDELENMSLYVQSKLLSVLEDKVVYPLGTTKPVNIDVRIIAATNKDIKQSVTEKKFREDLFYRLSEFTIYLPPLKDRVEDIPFFVHKFLMQTSEELDRPLESVPIETMDILMDYPWSGNVRELKNVIRRAILSSVDGIIRPENIEFLNRDKNILSSDTIVPLKELVAKTVMEIEKNAIKQALIKTKGNKSKAASLLQISYRSLFSKIKDYNMEENK